MNRLPKCIEIEFLPDARDSRKLQSRGARDRGSLARAHAPRAIGFHTFTLFTLSSNILCTVYSTVLYNEYSILVRFDSDFHASPSRVRVSRGRGGQRPHALIRSGVPFFSDPSGLLVAHVPSVCDPEAASLRAAPAPWHVSRSNLRIFNSLS